MVRLNKETSNLNPKPLNPKPKPCFVNSAMQEAKNPQP